MTCRQPARTEVTPRQRLKSRSFTCSGRSLWHSNGTPPRIFGSPRCNGALQSIEATELKARPLPCRDTGRVFVSPLAVFYLTVIIKLRLQRPLVLLPVGPMAGALCSERNAGACGTNGFNWDVDQPFRNTNRGFIHCRFVFWSIRRVQAPCDRERITTFIRNQFTCREAGVLSL
jgi:hypothetical protein